LVEKKTRTNNGTKHQTTQTNKQNNKIQKKIDKIHDKKRSRYSWFSASPLGYLMATFVSVGEAQPKDFTPIREKGKSRGRGQGSKNPKISNS